MGNISRRRFVSAAGLSAAGISLAGLSAVDSDKVSSDHSSDKVSFFGTQQRGIIDRQQAFLQFAVFDVFGNDRIDLMGLLREWSVAAAELCQGSPVSNLVLPSGDSGETTDRSPGSLTLTFGFGAALFGTDRESRFGLSGERPPALVDMPTFDHDEIDPRRSGGDICIQACSDDPIVGFHAVRTLARIARDRARLRWLQKGVSAVSGVPSATETSPRNLFGQHDGTNNIGLHDQAALSQHVWVGSEGPHWMTGGTYLIARRIRMQIETWDRVGTDVQDRALGRSRRSGDPLGNGDAAASIDLDAVAHDGTPVIPVDAHVRLASPDTNGKARMLRRGYNFDDGLDDVGALDAGLMFLAFVRDPRTQYIPMQERMSRSDALHAFLRHNGSGLFACPRGVEDAEAWIGQGLFA